MSLSFPDPAPSGLAPAVPRAIVVGIDDSPTSFRALDYAAGLARRQNSRLIAVHVRSMGLTACPADCYDFTAAAAAKAVLDAQDVLEVELRSEVDRLRDICGIETEFVLRTGVPVRELTAVAEQERADSIVVGSSIRAASRLSGSLAARLVRHRGCLVTVVP